MQKLEVWVWEMTREGGRKNGAILDLPCKHAPGQPCGVSRAGPEQEHRIPQASLLSPAVPSLTPRCPLVIFAMECASPSDSPGEQGLKLLPLLTQLPICKWVCLRVAEKAPAGGQGPLAGNDRDTHVYPLSTRPCACVCLCNIRLWAFGELDHLHVPRMYQT